MKNGKWVVWGTVVGVLGVNVFVGCAPTITVSRDDQAGGAAGIEDPGTSSGGGPGGSKGGAGGSDPGPGRGGSAVAAGTGGSAIAMGSGGDAVAAGGSAPVAGSGGSDIFQGMAGTSSVTDTCPCSRRPSSPESSSCPRGTGASITSKVGPEGGPVQLNGTPSTVGVPFRLQLDPGALDTDVELTLSELALSPPSDLFDVSPVYRIEPDAVEFAYPGHLQVPWTVASGLVPQGIGIYHADSPDGPWERLEDSYTNAGFEQATTTRSGYFIAAYPPTPALAACHVVAPVLDFSTVNCGNTDPEELFTNTCAKTFCHGTNFVAGLDLRSDAGLAARLLDVPATFGGIGCYDSATELCVPDSCPSGVLLVDSANPDQSWMLTKLTDNPILGGTDGCGEPMPIVSGVRTADYPCFRAIIESIAALPK